MSTITREISTLPTPPSRQRPATFSNEADAFLAALPDFTDDVNTVSSQMNTVAGEVNTNATIASDSAATATAKAQIATDKATEALASANNADTSEANALSYAQSALDSKNAAEAAAESINPDNLVYKTGDQTIAGVKTFSFSPIVPTPTADMQVSTKKYVDDGLGLKAPLESPSLTGTPTLNGEAIVKLSTDGLSVVKPNDANIKNQCTAWVNFDGTTTPPTIRDSFNVSSVVRTATGNYNIYFENEMDNTYYSCSTTCDPEYGNSLGIYTRALDYVQSTVKDANDINRNISYGSINIFGGKN